MTTNTHDDKIWNLHDIGDKSVTLYVPKTSWTVLFSSKSQLVFNTRDLLCFWFNMWNSIIHIWSIRAFGSVVVELQVVVVASCDHASCSSHHYECTHTHTMAAVAWMDTDCFVVRILCIVGDAAVSRGEMSPRWHLPVTQEEGQRGGVPGGTATVWRLIISDVFFPPHYCTVAALGCEISFFRSADLFCFAFFTHMQGTHKAGLLCRDAADEQLL